MTKTTLAKKKFKKCLRINTVLSSIGRCVRGKSQIRRSQSMGSGTKSEDFIKTSLEDID